MNDDEARPFVDRLMALWARPVPDGPAGDDAFGAGRPPGVVRLDLR